jgi:predicted flap endonuclease-1-like 5' DNA nuclease
VSEEEIKEIVSEAKVEDKKAPAKEEKAPAKEEKDTAAKEEKVEAPKKAPQKKAPAKKAAVKSDKKGDDLTKIAGIGKVYQGKLNDEGFYTYADVSNMSKEAIKTMEEKYSFKGDFKDAVASAKELAEA